MSSDTGTPRPPRWFSVVLVTAAALTALNGFVVGYGAVWFQLFGTGPDRDDYLVSAGGYLSAATLLALAATAGVLRGGRPWLGYAAGSVGAVLALCGVGSWHEAAVVEDRGPGINGVWDGVGGVVAWPWAWAVAALLVVAARHRARRA